MKKIDRKEKKHLEKFPVKRETISTKIERNIDPELNFEMRVRDKIHAKRMKKLHREEEAKEEAGTEEMIEDEEDEQFAD